VPAATGAGGVAPPAAGGGAGQSGADTACDQTSDCEYGEIAHDIASKADCVCLFGCPYLPLNKQTIARRQSQYAASCSPLVDGHGQACPIDDCVQLPAPNCVDHLCVAVRR
jgi:hypothetical protein